MTERMSDERLAEMRGWGNGWAAECVAEIDRARAAEAELRAELSRARALVNAISDLPGETEERYTYEQCAEYARQLYGDRGEAWEALALTEAARDRLRAVVVAQADADDACHRDHSLIDAWEECTRATEQLGRELRGKP